MKANTGDWVTLVENDVFKDRPFKVIMANPLKVMINTSIDGGSSNSLVPVSMIKSVQTPAEMEEQQQNSVIVERRLEKELFNHFDD